MRVLVIGGTGATGSLFVFRLLAAGHRVTLLCRGRSPDPFGARVERLLADRGQPAFARLLARRDFDVAVDFAAFTGEDGRRAVEALAGRVGHYVMISSGQVYLVRAPGPLAARRAREADFDGPLMACPEAEPDLSEWRYGMEKRACEEALIEAFDALRFPSTRLRIPMVNGERDRFRRLESYLLRLLDGGPVLLPDGGQNRTCHVYGAEVARFLVSILGRPASFGRAFNLSQEEKPTLSELVAKLASLTGSRSEILSVPAEVLASAGLVAREVSPFSTAWMSCLDPALAREEFGFSHLALDLYLGRIVASFLAHPPSSPPPGYEARESELHLALALRE
ncbi:MAG TPA: NAD-dependent epimerase/dehydratase family protein [Anaeromyxobacteraceae bacterium]|nr:NAD-dependent epimerase/dehydratase family protein [Anaeromyxobacteraceae bacterium]